MRQSESRYSKRKVTVSPELLARDIFPADLNQKSVFVLGSDFAEL